MLEIQLCSFFKNYEGFGFSILNVDNGGGFDRSLLYVGKRGDTWFLELFFMRVFPR